MRCGSRVKDSLQKEARRKGRIRRRKKIKRKTCVDGSDYAFVGADFSGSVVVVALACET